MLTLTLALGCGDAAPPSIDPNPVPPAAATQTVPDLPMGQLPQATLTRDEIVADEHVTLQGTVHEGCDGAVRIDVLEVSPKTPPRTLTVHQLPDGERTFSIAAPVVEHLQMTAICDSDRDGRISPTDGLSDLITVEPGQTDGLELAWVPNGAAALSAGFPAEGAAGPEGPPLELLPPARPYQKPAGP